jgi:hypothetical protein
MCFTPEEITEACGSAAGGGKRIALIPQSEVLSFGALDSEKTVPTITFAVAKRMFEIEFMDEQGGADQNDIGTVNSPAYEWICSFMLKGNNQKQFDYVNKVRQGRCIMAMEMNDGTILLAGNPTKAAYLRKINRKWGKKIEDPNQMELEAYFKSAEGVQVYSGTWASLFVAGS